MALRKTKQGRTSHSAALGSLKRVCLFSLLYLTYSGLPPAHDGIYVIVLDPGHGGSNIGAATQDGLSEKDLTLKVALELRRLLNERDDVHVLLTRDDDLSLGLWDRRDMSNANRADLFVSIHFNGSHNKAVNRTEVFYSKRESRRSAEVFSEKVSASVGSHTGLVQKVHWTVLWANRARLGAVLVEVSYLSHPSADMFLADEEHLDGIAHGFLHAVNTILDL